MCSFLLCLTINLLRIQAYTIYDNDLLLFQSVKITIMNASLVFLMWNLAVFTVPLKDLMRIGVGVFLSYLIIGPVVFSQQDFLHLRLCIFSSCNYTVSINLFLRWCQFISSHIIMSYIKMLSSLIPTRPKKRKPF